jgi:hypothetical protein
MSTADSNVLVPTIEFIFPDGFIRRQTIFGLCRGLGHKGQQRPTGFRFKGASNVRVTPALILWVANHVLPALSQYDEFSLTVACHHISPDLAPQIQAHLLKKEGSQCLSPGQTNK